jgi:hypothetical protein
LSAVQEEVEIFEKSEDSQVYETAYEEKPFSLPLFFGLLQPEPDCEIGQRRDGKERGKTPVPVSVEDVACDKQEDNPCSTGGKEQICSEDNCKEYKENKRVKQH